MNQILEWLKAFYSSVKTPVAKWIIVAIVAVMAVIYFLSSCATPGTTSVYVKNNASGVETHVSVSSEGHAATVTVDPKITPSIINPSN